jgi:uncharacterized protein YjcR
VAAEWAAIKAEYISTNASMRELAEKYGVSHDQMRKHAAKGAWKRERTSTTQKTHKKIVQKVIEQTASRETDRIMGLLAIGDKLAAKLDRAAGELGEYVVIKRKTTRREHSEYDEDGEGDGKGPLIEDVQEVVERGDALVSTTDLRNLATTLKTLCSVMDPAKAEDATGTGLVITIADSLREAAE